MSVAWRVAASLTFGASVVSGCDLDIPPASHVTTTEILTIRHFVAELGPLHPDRVGPAFADPPPIAEVLPGDRLRLEAIVIDRDGRPLAEDELETLWVQCGYGACGTYGFSFSEWVFNRECSDYTAHTMDTPCVLGAGTGSFEYIVPELDASVVYDSLLQVGRAQMRLFGVVAWDGRRAADCWASRRGDQAELDRCEFIYREIAVGPYWWMQSYAAQLGFELDEPVDELPPLVLLEPANRIPKPPTLGVWVDDELRAEGVTLPTISVEPGAIIFVTLGFDWATQALQGSYVPLGDDPDAFALIPEQVRSRTLTTGAIRRLAEIDPATGDEIIVIDNGWFTYQVDANAEPGRSRILIVYRDDSAATDWLSVDFEVQ